MQDAGLLHGPDGPDGADGAELRGARRQARVDLVRWLLDDGSTVGDLQEAVAQRRLVLLPLERALQVEGARVAPREVARRTGFTLDQLDQLRETLGLPLLDPDSAALSPIDVEAFTQAGLAVEAGLPFDGVLEINAVLATSMPGLAAALRHLATSTLVTSDDERLAALELASSARDLLPLLMPVLEYALRAHLEQQVVTDYVDTGLDREEGSPHSVGFADLVGFTRLSEVEQPRAVGALNERLAALARGALTGRARLVKTIGDAVMLTAPTPGELVPVLLDLLDAVAAADDLPALHAGVAHGPVLQRRGDLFGRPVNRASRLTDRAAAGGLVCDDVTAQALGEAPGLVVEDLEPVELKGLAGPQPLFAVRRSPTTATGSSEADR